MSTVRHLLGLIRFSHTIFALPFALLSAVLAWQSEPFRILDLVGILLCMIFARSAAMAFNRITDRRIDAANPRTQNRHLPSGKLSLRTVVLFTLITSGGFVASTLLFLYREPSNPWPLMLSVPVLLFVLAYSLTKRFFALTHFWLGASLMLAPLAAWIAIRGLVELETPLLIGAGVFFWVAGFDMLYSCQDVEFDRQAKLFSVPAWIGVRATLRLAFVCHVLMLIAMFALGYVSPFLGMVYFVGLGILAVILLVQHWLVSPNDLSRVNAAFFWVNGLVSIGLFALVLLQVVVGV